MSGPSIQAELAPFPLPPRPISSVARRRSWAEYPVRIWIILTILILGITAYFVISRLNEALNDRWLIAHGTPVIATFDSIDGDYHVAAHKHLLRDHPMPAAISYAMNGKQSFPIELPAKVGTFADVGGPFPIRVDPKNPTRWTEATQPISWSQELTAVYLLVPICLLLIAMVLWRRRSVLNVWRHGELADATVVAVRHTATAPNGRLVRCHYNASDRRVFSILVPARQAPAKGEIIPLLRSPAKPSRAVLAQLYWPR